MNTRNPAIKRLSREWKEIEFDHNDHYRAYPLVDDLFEWHFIVSGPVDTPFTGGLYHGRILLPPEYPFKPPSVIFSTPNGRFQTNVKICLSITGYHPEYWQPAWGIRTALMAIISMLPQKDQSSIGSISCSDDDVKRLALKSIEWKCSHCTKSNREIWHGMSAENLPQNETTTAEANASVEPLGQNATNAHPSSSSPTTNVSHLMQNQPSAGRPPQLIQENSILLYLPMIVVFTFLVFLLAWAFI